MVGEKFGEPAMRMRADASEDMAEVSEWINSKPLARRDQTVENSRRVSTVVAAIKRPIAATDGDAARSPLRRSRPWR